MLGMMEPDGADDFLREELGMVLIDGVYYYVLVVKQVLSTKYLNI